MKKVVNKIIFLFVCVFTFVVGSNFTVSAAEPYAPKDNMNVSSQKGNVYKMTVGGGSKDYTYYVVNNFTDTELVLGYKDNIPSATSMLQYNSHVSLVKCVGGLGICSEVEIYEFKEQGNALLKDRFVLDLSVLEGSNYDKLAQKPFKQAANIYNGVDLTALVSAYGIDHTVFLVVDYYTVETYYECGFLCITTKEKTKIGNQASQVISILNLEELGGPVKVSSVENGNERIATIQASVNLRQVKYFASDEEYDFAKKASDEGKSIKEVYETVAANYEVQTVDVSNVEGKNATVPPRIGRVFETEVRVTVQSDEHYYLLAEDELGNVDVYDISVPGDNGGVGVLPDDTNPGNNLKNAGNTAVGKYILIALIVLLVISAVAVIVQKIVDHKRKLY